MPALLHLWIEKVLAHGWAYGAGGDAVRGKTTLWVATTGAPVSAYAPGEMHGHSKSSSRATKQRSTAPPVAWTPDPDSPEERLPAGPG